MPVEPKGFDKVCKLVCTLNEPERLVEAFAKGKRAGRRQPQHEMITRKKDGREARQDLGAVSGIF